MKLKQTEHLKDNKKSFKVFFAPSGKQALVDDNKTVPKDTPIIPKGN